MRFKVKGKEYDAAGLDDVTLRDTLLFESQMRELGRPMVWTEMLGIVAHLATIEDDQARGTHPDAMWSFAVTIWASRRLAGENVTIAEAADFRIPADIEWLDEQAPDPHEGQPAEGLAASE